MDNHEEKEERKPAPRVRPASVFRTLVLTALAALPMKGCSGTRQPPPDSPQEVSQSEQDAGGGEEADDPSESDAGSSSTPDAGSRPEDPNDGRGTVFRGGPEDDASHPGEAGESSPSEQDGGRVWRGGPGEEHHDDDRDAGASPDDARRIRDDAGRSRPDVYQPPVTDYGIPDPRPMPMYGVEPVPDPVPPYGVVPVPVPAYAVPYPGPVSEYAVIMPDDDDDGPVLRYMAPFTPNRKPNG